MVKSLELGKDVSYTYVHLSIIFYMASSAAKGHDSIDFIDKAMILANQ